MAQARSSWRGGSLVWMAALALSGAAGLLDQVVWVRRAALVFGSTTAALTTVLIVFFSGLAIGSALFGRMAERTTRPLRMAALLETALAALVLLSLPAFALAESWFGAAYRALPAESLGLSLVRGALVAVVVLPAAVLMGGTLPLFVRASVRDALAMGANVANLYAVNTLGATAGALGAGLVLVPRFGMRATLCVAAALNALAAVALARAREPDAIESAPAPAREQPTRMPIAIGALVFATGFVALGQEVLWSRFLALVLRDSVTGAALALALTLAGIVLGSALIGRASDRLADRAFVFGALQVAGGLAVTALLHAPPAWWHGLGGDVATAAMLLLPPAILAGASFPLAVRLALDDPRSAGSVVGRLLALSTLGGIAGAATAGFALLPGAGLDTSVRVLTGVGVASGVVAWFALGPTRPTSVRLACAILAPIAWLAVPGTLGTKIPDDHLGLRAARIATREGVETHMAVVRGSGGDTVLEMDRWWQGQDSKTHQIMAAHLPMLLHADPKRVLVVGVGAGQTPARFLMHPLESLDCVDIEPRVFDVIREHFPHAWMDDPRARLLKLDGRNHVMHSGESYDVISLEVGQLFRPGAASFYSSDFYRRARARLEPGGLVSQFVPLAILTPDMFRGVVASFLDVFPNATLWTNTSELLLVGGRDGVPRLQPSRIAFARADSVIAADLEWSPWGGPADALARPGALSGTFVCGPASLARLAGGTRVYRDDAPALEFAARGMSVDTGRDALIVPLLRAHLDPVDMGTPGTAESAEADAFRNANLGDLVAAASVRAIEGARERRDVAGAGALAQAAIAANPRNLNARRLLGDALVLQGRAAEAESAFAAALRISGRDARVHAGLGFVLMRTGRLPAAAEHLRLALANGPESAELRNNLGAALGQMGDYPAALREFERAVELNPADQGARQNVLALRKAMGR